MIASIYSGVQLTEAQEQQLAGDIENWLLTQKSIISEVRVE
jgi:hypothetical protein